jgi:hypothetical protein
MIGEQTIAAQIGYFATMLYNPNNIAIEIPRSRPGWKPRWRSSSLG